MDELGELSELALLLTVAGGFIAILGGLAWLASRIRASRADGRRGTIGTALGAAMSAHDEIFHPAAHRSHFEIMVQERRMVPAASPDARPGDCSERRPTVGPRHHESG